MLLRLVLLFLTLVPTARPDMLLYPMKFFQAEGEVVQLLGRPSRDDERFTGFYVLEASGRIHHVSGHERTSVRLDDGRPADAIWLGAGKLFRLSEGRIEVMGSVPQKWSLAPMGEFEGREVASVWPNGVWAQLADGTILGFGGTKPPWSIGVHPEICSAVGEILVLVDGSVLRAGRQVEHRGMFHPKPIWAATPRYYRYSGALMMVDEAGRFSLIRDFPGVPITSLSAAPPRPVIQDILSLAPGKTDDVDELVVLKADGKIFDISFFQETDSNKTEVKEIYQLPGAKLLETVEWGTPEMLWGLVATEEGAVYGLDFRDMERWEQAMQLRQRQQRFEALYATQEQVDSP